MPSGRSTLKGTLNCIQIVVPHMIENGYGKIVNLSSVWGKEGRYQRSVTALPKQESLV